MARSSSSFRRLSPHTWGCPAVSPLDKALWKLVPTHVGMSRPCHRGYSIFRSCPHTRGDVPYIKPHLTKNMSLSPHTWGCPVSIFSAGYRYGLVPTHVGMSRGGRYVVTTENPCPHTRGDVPHPAQASKTNTTLSPHTWGCPEQSIYEGGDLDLVPTHVGMSRHMTKAAVGSGSCPHTRGDVP